MANKTIVIAHTRHEDWWVKTTLDKLPQPGDTITVPACRESSCKGAVTVLVGVTLNVIAVDADKFRLQVLPV